MKACKIKLSGAEFTDALDKGLGRAFWYVKNHGDKGIEDVLLHAILHNHAFDMQVEGDRGDWMYDMAQFTGQPEFYFDKVISGYMDDEDDWDVRQKSRILLRLARDGNKEARELLYFKVQTNFYDVVADILIDLDGLNGLLAFAKTCAVREETEYHCDNWLITYTSQTTGEKETIEFLEDAAKNDPDIAEYINTVKRSCGTLILQPKGESRPKMTLAKVIEAAERGEILYVSETHEFMRNASTEEVEQLYSLLLKEIRSKQLRCYLRLFFKREIPYITEKILELTKSDDKHIRNAALRVLSNTKDRQVRSFALEKISQGDLRAITILKNNYKKGDCSFILNEIKTLQDKYELHDASSDLLEVILKNKLETENGSLKWIYENTPCSYCRGRSFSRLLELKDISDDILKECFYDCSKDTRQAAKEYLNGRI